MKKSLILLCLLIFSSCSKQEVGDRDRDYNNDNNHDHYHDHDDDYDDRDDRRNHWWPW